MKSYRFPGKLFYLKGGFIILLSLYLQSCVKDELNDISGNVMLKQSFSIPLGPKEVTIDAPLVSDTSSKRGIYGAFYYDGLPYSSNSPRFASIFDTVNLDLTTNTNYNLIKKLTFSILTESDYPTKAYLQVYLVDEDGITLDKFFKNSDLETIEAKFNSNGELINPSQNITTDVVYEGPRLELLKKAKFLAYQVNILSIFFNPAKLSNKNKFKVTIGARAELEYNTKELNK